MNRIRGLRCKGNLGGGSGVAAAESKGLKHPEEVLILHRKTGGHHCKKVSKIQRLAAVGNVDPIDVAESHPADERRRDEGAVKIPAFGDGFQIIVKSRVGPKPIERKSVFEELDELGRRRGIRKPESDAAMAITKGRICVGPKLDGGFEDVELFNDGIGFGEFLPGCRFDAGKRWSRCRRTVEADDGLGDGRCGEAQR